MNVFEDIHAFHEKFGFSKPKKPTILESENMGMRLNFLLEELMETAEACGFSLAIEEGNDEAAPIFIPNPELQVDHAKFVDGLADLMYVVIGTAWLTNMPLRDAWRLVQEANMQKVRAVHPSQSKRGTAFDVVKPDGWKSPDIESLFKHPPKGY